MYGDGILIPTRSRGNRRQECIRLRVTRWIGCGAAGVLAALSLVACAPEQAVVIAGHTMGTRYRVSYLCAVCGDHNRREITRAIERSLATVDAQMSTFRTDSELARFNARRDTAWHETSPALNFVLRAANRISAETGGAFDVTVAAAVERWGFGAAGRVAPPPSERELNGLRDRIGYHQIDVRSDPPAARKRVPSVTVDLSAIAKGYAVDKLADLLSERGLGDFLVEIGGEVRAFGHGPGGRRWRVGIEMPRDGYAPLAQIVELDNQALASSGDYRNYFKHAGRRYSHTIEPRTAAPVSHDLVAVSVLHARAMDADAYATALLVNGPVDGIAFAAKQGLSALFFIHDGAGITLTRTGEFPRPQGEGAP